MNIEGLFNPETLQSLWESRTDKNIQHLKLRKCCIFCAVESRIYRTKIQHLLYKYSITEIYSTNVQHLNLAEALNLVSI